METKHFCKQKQFVTARITSYNVCYTKLLRNSRLLARYARPDDKGLELLKHAMHRLNLSARAYDRILKVARTIADLEVV